jgi:membrane-bound metal-dependent hydrolase YbcI (DUF457 family)
MALGYMLGKASSKLLRTDLNTPLIFALSIIPDIDILFQPFGLEHRGPTHSIIICVVAFIPILIIQRKKALPYLIAVSQHSVVGDFLSGGRFQLLWPVTTQYYGTGTVVTSQAGVALECIVFFASIILMLKARDTGNLFRPHNSNLVLAIPTFTVLLPIFLSYPLQVPVLLIPPHLIYLFIFSLSLLITIPKVKKDVLSRVRKKAPV